MSNQHREDKLVITDDNKHMYIKGPFSADGKGIIDVDVKKLVIEADVCELEVIGNIDSFNCSRNGQLTTLVCFSKEVYCRRYHLF